MEKILVISWFYPPCNLTASQRTKAWAQYFPEKGLYPIIITRNWDKEIKSNTDLHIPSGGEIKIVKNSSSETHFLPYYPSIFSKLLATSIGSVRVFKYLFLTLSILLEHVISSFSEYHSFFKYVKNYVKANPDIRIVIVSGAPFHLFKLGHQLSTKFGLKFIADYRDAWTDNEIIVLKNVFLDKLKRKIDRYYERKWLQSAIFFTTVSEHLKNLIGKTIDKEGVVIYNGYFEEDFAGLKSKSKNKEFILLYSGSLYYKFQNLTILAEGLKILDDKLKKANKDASFKLIFLGAGWDQRATDAIRQSFYKTPNLVKITNRLSKEEAVRQLIDADCYLMISYNGAKGIISSKLFEYLYLKKPILNAPSDQDIVQEVTSRAGLGINANTAIEVCDELWKLIHNHNTSLKIDEKYIKSFSRKSQTEVLAELLLDLERS